MAANGVRPVVARLELGDKVGDELVRIGVAGKRAAGHAVDTGGTAAGVLKHGTKGNPYPFLAAEEVIDIRKLVVGLHRSFAGEALLGFGDIVHTSSGLPFRSELPQ